MHASEPRSHSSNSITGPLLLLRQLEELSQLHADLEAEHAAALAAARKSVADLEGTYASNADLVDRELRRMGKSVKLVEQCDLGAMTTQVHRMSRHIDETDITVKHIKEKVRPRGRPQPERLFRLLTHRHGDCSLLRICNSGPLYIGPKHV